MSAVLLDLDGVLIHSKEVWFALLKRLRRDHGYPDLDRATFERMWGRSVAADVEEIFFRHTIDDVTRWYADHFLDHTDHLEVDPEGPEVIATLRARGVGTAIVTNSPRPLADRLVEQAGLHPDTLVGGTDCEQAKPAPDMLLEACRRLGVAPVDAVMVGDTETDRGAAQAAGVPFCGFGGIEGRWSVRRLREILRLVG